MSKPPVYWHKAKKILSRKDPVLGKIIKKYNKGFLTTRGNPFFSLCRTVIGQQISTKAADSIWLKFEKKCKGKINAKTVSKLSLTSLRSCGLSRLKAKGIKSLARKILNRSFDPKLIKKMSDEDAIAYLCDLRQIGKWTSEMVLAFSFNRSNIWPIQDIGLLRAISVNYKKKYLPPRSFVEKLHKKFSPMCTIAVWYLWRSIDNEPIQY